jgi:uncharacterized protein (DUF433 family)/DNA-binding transcriptional MerR regulator
MATRETAPQRGRGLSVRQPKLEHVFDLILDGFWKALTRWRYPPLREVAHLPPGAVTDTSRAPALGQGIYTVGEVVRILRPARARAITRGRVHYWLDEGLLAQPIRWGRRGVPTLLTYQQVFRIRLLQRLRDDLGFSLRKARTALEWILDHVTAEEWHRLRFYRTGAGDVGVTDGRQSFSIPAQQVVFDTVLPELEEFLEQSRRAWEQGVIPIAGFDLLVSDPQVMGGSPVIVGTRVETAFIGHLAPEVDLVDLTRMFPHVDEEALRQAVEFELAA